MTISSTSSSASAALQAAANSSDPLQQNIGATLLRRSLQQDGQNTLDLIQSTASPAAPAEPGSLGYSVNVHA